jgi:hypothetical protein
MLTRQVQRLRSRGTPRRLLAILFALTLAPSIAELHSAHPVIDDSGAPSTVAAGALHARQAAHLESSEITVRPSCSACLIQRQPLDVAPPARDAGVHRALSPQPTAEERSALADAPRDPSIPRGPPSA